MDEKIHPGARPHRGYPAWRQRHPRFTFHFTPTYSSWMNLVERWVADWNDNPRSFVWHKTADQIFDNLAGYLDRVPDSGH